MDNNVNLNEVSRISAGTAFKGEITCTGDIRVDGKFDGRLNSKGRLVAGEKAVMNGDVICQNVDFSGKMDKGTFYVADTLSLKSGCSVTGDLRYKRLQVDLDAKITGTLSALTESEFVKAAAEKPVVKAEKSNDTGKEE
ncbi:MAG: polymer-forming cytoskeletal protein [Bacteroidales bacterium]|jgi:cytoskeletal protein CcmA (bactofilin family)|nr:polymer-forming cytoskeletal protein [Bacteroidales bacterium]